MLARQRIRNLVEGLPQSREALAYAERLHAGQRRKVDGAPFIRHPIEVASLLYDAGAPDHLIAAGVLHDALEKSPAEATELAGRFGPRITRIVLAVTEDDRIEDYEQRKAAAREQAAAGGRDALMVLAADKISKVRELTRETTAARQRGVKIASRSRRRRFTHYRECLLLLEEHAVDRALVRQLRAELDKLAAEFERHAVVAGARA